MWEFKSENELAAFVVNTCLQIHRKIGPGLFEKVYEEVLGYECAKAGIATERQKTIDLMYDGIDMGVAYRPDIMLENKLIIEVKSVEKTLEPVHYKQILSYLKIADCKLGLLVNFNVILIKDGIHRIANKL